MVVPGQVLGAVVQHRVHLVEHRALVADAVLEEGGQVVRGPAALGEVLGQQAGGLVAEDHPTGHAQVLLQGTHGVARGVAFATVAEHFHQVLAALPFLALALGRLQLHAVLVDHVPEGHAETHVEGEGQVGLRARPGDGLQAHQVGVDGVGVFALEQVVGGVRHGRVQLAAVLALALGHRLEEVVGAVVADTMLLVRGDVGAVDGAERRYQRQSAGVLGAAFDAVASHAVGGAGQVLAAFDQRLVRRLFSGLGGERQ
ncbi:hypothetical protein D3C84_769260 [compost metagenome]